ncbi:MAG: nickel transporter [Betaproteobacteria bacterium]|jgi:high-affinity nickel-transport protein|nr:nickel transporter [Betaproteobacteria bacterium]
MELLHAFALALLLGMQHGLDPDHLAAIDGLTRFNARVNPARARWCGLWFSLGHGTLVTLATLLVATLAAGWQLPEWVDTASGWVTVGLLVTIGLINVWSVYTGQAETQGPSGVRGRYLRGLLAAQHPVTIFGIGALFALSFETLTQASVFALGAGTAGASGNVWVPLAMGAVFTGGMMVTDAVNGLWLYRLARNTQRHSALAMRRLALAIATLSFAMAAWAAARMLSPEVDTWFDGSELVLGLAVLAGVAGCYLLAMRGGSRSAAAPLK